MEKMKKKSISDNIWNFSSKINAMLGVLLILAILPFMPNFYYSGMRGLVFIFTGFMAYNSYAGGAGRKNPWTWIFLVIALVFNPFKVMALSTIAWDIIYVSTSALFLFLSYRDRF
jgi:hypothetical protein